VDGWVRKACRNGTGPPGLGASYTIVGAGPTGEVPGTYRVTAWEENRRFEGRFESKVFAFSEVYTLRGDGNSTHVELRAEMQPRGIFRLLTPVLRFAFARQVRQDHVKLKALLEA
jgi:polyketide cyclase/dehydrase/lipid transport protein